MLIHPSSLAVGSILIVQTNHQVHPLIEMVKVIAKLQHFCLKKWAAPFHSFITCSLHIMVLISSGDTLSQQDSINTMFCRLTWMKLQDKNSVAADLKSWTTAPTGDLSKSASLNLVYQRQAVEGYLQLLKSCFFLAKMRASRTARASATSGLWI